MSGVAVQMINGRKCVFCRYVRPDMHTVCVGKAWGNAAMLLASGKKGERHSLPHASIMTCPPRLNRTQDVATNIMIKVRKIMIKCGHL